MNSDFDNYEEAEELAESDLSELSDVEVGQNIVRVEPEVELEWVDSTRSDKSKPIYDGALFKFDKDSVDKKLSFYRCDQWEFGCKMRLHLVKATKKLRSVLGSHSIHPVSPWRPINAMLRDEQVRLITTFTDMTPNQVITQTTANLSPVQKRFLPRKDSEAGRLGKKRAKSMGLPPPPTTIVFEIPDELMRFSDGKSFILHDTGATDPKRIVVCGDQGMIPSFDHINALYGDGTFACCPLQDRRGWKQKMFSQLYVLVAERARTILQEDGSTKVHRFFIPIFHCLVPAMDNETMERLFKIIQRICPELKPDHFKSDFERPQVNGAKAVFDGIECKGDSFHLIQAITGRVKKLKLLPLYMRDVEIYEQVRMMIVPFYAPPNKMIYLWRQVIKPLISRPELTPMVEYIERTWFGVEPVEGSNGRKPFYSIKISNQYRAVIEGRPCHNNPSESNNNKIQKHIKSNPSMWHFLIKLREAYRGDILLLYNDWVNGVIKPRKAEDVKRDERILLQVNRWADVEAKKLSKKEWSQGVVTALKNV